MTRGRDDMLFSAAAVPEVAFPFNSQVPAIPRVNQPYSYQLSPSTFSPSAANFVYSLSQQPAWLQIDSMTRTLQGTPGTADAGPATFTLTAADGGGGAAHMECTLVVSADPAPQLQGDISQQLSASVNLSSADPAIVTLLPSTAFKFDFQQASFIDIVPRKLYYYATLADRTPLPAWLSFDAGSGSLTFSGTAPQLSSFPQSFNISLIASDVEGFAGTSAYFTMVIGTRQLAFVPDEQDISIKPGQQFTMTGLMEGLYLNGMQLSSDEIASVSSTVPSWLTVDSQTLAVSGRAPNDATDGTYSITVTDKMGDAATMSLKIDTSGVDLLSGNIGTLIAYAGQDFDYVIPSSMVDQHNPTLEMSVPADADWLTFDAAKRELSGHVPSSASAGILQATLTASADGEVESQRFAINVKESIATSTSGSSTIAGGETASASETTGTSSTTSRVPSQGIANSASNRTHMRPGIIAAVVLSVLLAVAILIALLVFCRRRRQKQQQSYVDYLPSPTSSRRDISRPIMNPDNEAIMVTTDVHRDVEKHAGSDGSGSRSASAQSKRSEMTETSHAPQLALKIPRHSARASRWNARLSKISQVSSIGDGGEDAIKSDSNIPEWGQAPDLVNRDTHHSFSLPAEIARASRQSSERSPKKRVGNRRRGRHRAQKSGAGLGISEDGRSVSRHRSKKRSGGGHMRNKSSFGLSATIDRSSVGTTSTATRGTSVLSARPSTSEFPRPPSGSTSRRSGRYSVPRLSMLELDQGKSIRLVGRSDSVRDTRSMAEKRQSFIRNRASTTIESPLFAHGSRAPSISKRSTSRSGSYYTSTASASDNCSRPTDSHLRAFSESSSVLDPSPRNPKRLSQRVKAAFPPDYPRAITQTTLGAATDDWRTVSRHGSHSSGFYTTSESDERDEQDDLAAQMALPRCQRSWVLPGEASPTPPPAPPASRQSSTGHNNGHPMTARERLKKRLNRDSNGQMIDHGISSSPLSTSVIVPSDERSGIPAIPRKASGARTRNRLSEPLSLVSADSLKNRKGARMRLLHAASAKRPVSVDDVHRLSSMKAEPEADTRAGSEIWEDIEAEVRARKSKERLQQSSSGPAFL